MTVGRVQQSAGCEDNVHSCGQSVQLKASWSIVGVVCRTGLEKPRFKKVVFFWGGGLSVFSTKTDVAKHESVTKKHLKSASPKR